MTAVPVLLCIRLWPVRVQRYVHGTEKSLHHATRATPMFNAQTFLDWAGLARAVVQ